MSKYLSIIIGACLFSFIGFLCASGLSYIYEMQFARSQDDMDSFAVFLVLIVMPAFAIGGGAAGFFGHKNLSRHSQNQTGEKNGQKQQKTQPSHN